MKKPLAKLTKVDLRQVWGHEALDFTNWLAQKENIDIKLKNKPKSLMLAQTNQLINNNNVTQLFYIVVSDIANEPSKDLTPRTGLFALSKSYL